MSIEQPAKRRRASQLGLLSSGSPPPAAGVAAAGGPMQLDGDVDEQPAQKPDVFEFLAKRAGKQRELEAEVHRLQEREAQLASQLDSARLEVGQLKVAGRSVSAKQEAREMQLQLQLQEQQEALRKEVERGAALAFRLRQAEAAASDTAAAQGRASQAPQAAPADPSAAAQQQQLQLQVTQLKLQLEQLEADKEEEQRRAVGVLATERQRFEAEAATVRLLQQQLEDVVGLAQGASRQRHELESSVAEQERTLVQLRGQLAEARGSEGDAVLVRSLREQLWGQEALAAEAKRLKEQEM